MYYKMLQMYEGRRKWWDGDVKSPSSWDQITKHALEYSRQQEMEIDQTEEKNSVGLIIEASKHYCPFLSINLNPPKRVIPTKLILTALDRQSNNKPTIKL